MTMLIPKTPRLEDKGYLAWLRQQRCCCGCLQGPPCDAAHIRSASLKHGKTYTAKGRKPDDRWALPLKHAHHMAQHDFGNELVWWEQHRINPFELAIEMYKRFKRSTR